MNTEDSVIYEGRQTALHTAGKCQLVIQLGQVVQVNGASHRLASRNLLVSVQLHRLLSEKVKRLGLVRCVQAVTP